MTMSGLSIALDIAVLAALGGTIFYAARLGRYFATLKADRADMQKLVASLDLAATRAESAVRLMKEAAHRDGQELQDQISRGRVLFDELALMIEAGDNLADRLSAAAEKSRKAAQLAQAPAMPPALPPQAPPPDPGGPRTRAERELADAVKSGKGGLS